METEGNNKTQTEEETKRTRPRPKPPVKAVDPDAQADQLKVLAQSTVESLLLEADELRLALQTKERQIKELRRNVIICVMGDDTEILKQILKEEKDKAREKAEKPNEKKDREQEQKQEQQKQEGEDEKTQQEGDEKFEGIVKQFGNQG